MTALLRILILDPIAFILACAAAGAAIAVAILLKEPDTATHGVAASLLFVGITYASALFAGWFALVPALVAIALAEAFGWRSVYYWLAVGGGIGLAGYLTNDWVAMPTIADERIPMYIGAGFVGGLAYWLIAGRLAGVGAGWLAPRPKPIAGPSDIDGDAPPP